MDTRLVERSKRGDSVAFDALISPLVGQLHGVALRMLGEVDAADDATQDTLVSAWRYLPRLRRSDRFEAWLWRILVHTCYAESDRRRRRQGHLRPLTTDEQERSDPFGDVVQRDALERAFERLPAEQRAALVLRHYLGFSSNEIADVMEIRPATARTRLHYAHRAMRAALEADARIASGTMADSYGAAR